MPQPTVKVIVENSVATALDGIRERYAFHRATGWTQGASFDKAWDDNGLDAPKTSPQTFEKDPLVIRRISEIKATVAVKTELDYEWLVGEALKQYRKVDSMDGVQSVRAAQAGLDQLAKLMGLDVTKIELAGKDGKPLVSSDPLDVVKRIAELFLQQRDQKPTNSED